MTSGRRVVGDNKDQLNLNEYHYKEPLHKQLFHYLLYPLSATGELFVLNQLKSKSINQSINQSITVRGAWPVEHLSWPAATCLARGRLVYKVRYLVLFGHTAPVAARDAYVCM